MSTRIRGKTFESGSKQPVTFDALTVPCKPQKQEPITVMSTPAINRGMHQPNGLDIRLVLPAIYLTIDKQTKVFQK